MPSWSRIAALIVAISAFARLGLAADTLPVYVSIVPQKYLVQQIGRERVDVRIMVQPGASPATYEPKPAQMAALSNTRIYFAIGVPFENVWLSKIAAANPAMTVVRSDAGIEKLAMAAHHDFDAAESRHGHQGHDDHPGEEGLDPHIWLSPPLVKIQVKNMMAALQRIDPAHSAAYEANGRNFMDQIDRLDAELKQIFAGKAHLRFMVFHPAWGYFASAYGLQQVPIEIEGKDPKPAQLKALIEHARGSGIKVIFVQPQFSTKSAALVAREIGGQVAFADPLAADWMANLRGVAEKFRAALR